MPSDLLQRYHNQSLRYLDNAWRLLRQGETDKASELLWGSMAEAVKAVAANKDVELRSHDQVWSYAQGIAREWRDHALFHAFHAANSLHGNFYEVRLQAKDVWPLAEEVRTAVRKLLEALPRSS